VIVGQKHGIRAVLKKELKGIVGHQSYLRCRRAQLSRLQDGSIRGFVSISQPENREARYGRRGVISVPGLQDVSGPHVV
jgi:hypothetical protein